VGAVKIAVVGASGLIGTKVANLLRDGGHDVVAASRASGVDVVTGHGLAGALAGANAVVDVTNAPGFEPGAVLRFFTASAQNIATAASAAGVGHWVVLSIVGVDGLPDSPYMRAKVEQERIVAESGVPYTVLRATQFVEFTDAIVDSLTVDGEVRVPDALIQPIPADAVALAVTETAVGEPLNGVRNIGGAEATTFEAMARDVLARRGDATTAVVVDAAARYFGAALGPRSLVTADADRDLRI
jgi:uncharacterized protein YbjT (DUF2867 family)